MRVLLVDDEKKFALMLAKRLELRGIQAKFVYSGAEAIEIARQGERFDVAVLDVKMPGIGGIELRHELSDLDPGVEIYFSDRPRVEHRFRGGGNRSGHLPGQALEN